MPYSNNPIQIDIKMAHKQEFLKDIAEVKEALLDLQRTAEKVFANLSSK